MKTAEEIYEENGCNKHSEIIQAMKEYANQKLEKAMYLVSLLETKVYTTPQIDEGFNEGIDAAMESIRSLKD